MRNDLQARLAGFINNPLGVLVLDDLTIGRFKLRTMMIVGREAAINAQELIQSVCEKTKRYRIRKDGTRYPELLPMGTPARLLSEEINDYLRDLVRRNLQPRTIEAIARTLEILKIACGDIPVSRIRHPEIYTLWDLLRWAPPNITTDPELSGLTAEDIIAIGKAAAVPTPAVATFELHRRFLSTFFEKLVKAHAIPFSPMAPFGEMKRDLIEDPNRPSRYFTSDELQKIFNPDTYIPWASKFPHRWWAPIIGLYTGARINEVAQLMVADIVEENGVWCLWIRKTDPKQSLKGKSAVRKFPLPQAILDAGFLDFREDMLNCGHPRLFPHLSAGVNRTTGKTNARYSQALLIQFGSYLKDLGFRKGVGFHGFRHTLATELDGQEVREENIALITGHALSKKVPSLTTYYIDRKPENVRARQTAALALYRPLVQLPVYTRGQFASRLGKGAKFYP